jgi:hypothetical protein
MRVPSYLSSVLSSSEVQNMQLIPPGADRIKKPKKKIRLRHDQHIDPLFYVKEICLIFKPILIPYIGVEKN